VALGIHASSYFIDRRATRGLFVPIPSSCSPTSTAQLQTTTANDLIERINAEATEIQTLKAPVGIAASVGGSKLGKITEYQEIRGYILARKPSSLRMIGLFPILQNRVFDMVSSGPGVQTVDSV
jgi:hypothetical protein